MKPQQGFRDSADVVVVGAGLIGLATAIALAEAGVRVLLIGDLRPGEASMAAAGLLAPSVEQIAAGREFAFAARDRYPEYIRWLREHTGISVSLNVSGILDVALNDDEGKSLHRAAGTGRWLGSGALQRLEPSLAHAAGAAMYELDGCVDNVALITALKALAERHSRITLERATVVELDAATSTLLTGEGRRVAGDAIVVATGAWTSQLRGLPRDLPIEPVRGQMIAFRGTPPQRPIFGAGIYAVPRDGAHTLIGSTMERVGFDAATTPEGLERLREAAKKLCPSATAGGEAAAWAGLRPVTPDLLPIIGRDPEYPALFYGCGHSRNGILMGPLTGQCLANLITGNTLEYDLSAFAVTRFREQLPG